MDDLLLRRMVKKHSNGLLFGKVVAQDDTGNAQKLQVRVDNLTLIDGVKTPYYYGITSVPPVGSDVSMLTVGGDRSNAIVLSTGNQQQRLRNLEPGAVGVHNAVSQAVMHADGTYVVQTGSTITITAGGAMTITTNGPVTINAPTVVINGDLNVSGDVTAGYGGGDSVTLQHHKHPTAALGGPSMPTPGT